MGPNIERQSSRSSHSFMVNKGKDGHIIHLLPLLLLMNYYDSTNNNHFAENSKL